MTHVYRLVRIRHVEDYLATGWIPTDALAGCHHGRWSVLMRACCCYEEAA